MFLLGSSLPDECFRKEGPRESTLAQSQKAEVQKAPPLAQTVTNQQGAG